MFESQPVVLFVALTDANDIEAAILNTVYGSVSHLRLSYDHTSTSTKTTKVYLCLVPFSKFEKQ